MKAKILIATVMLCLGSISTAKAQISKLKGTNVVFVVSDKTHKVSHLLLDGDFPMMKKEALRKYSNSRFYKGTIKGDYKTTKYGILPPVR